MFLISLLFTDPITYFMIMLSVIFGLTIHEYFHGWVAYMLGDDTAKSMGRLTVNPLAHFDPILTSLIFIVGLGAAKPVPVNPYRLKYGEKGMLLVSLAGIVANFLSAVVFVILFKILIATGRFDPSNLIFPFLQQLVIMNLVLMVFNLIPLPPLDGSKVLLSVNSAYKGIYNYFAHNQAMSLILAILLFSWFGWSLINFFAISIDRFITGVFF